IDAMQLPRVDLIKLDVEGMELEALEGARITIERCRPVMLVETIKSDDKALRSFLEQSGYVVVAAGQDLLAIHGSDETLTQLQLDILTPQAALGSQSSAA
ncbi:MAG: FkbM family methyltransferase, partial [Bradyrhizobium sp.]